MIESGDAAAVGAHRIPVSTTRSVRSRAILILKYPIPKAKLALDPSNDDRVNRAGRNEDDAWHAVLASDVTKENGWIVETRRDPELTAQRVPLVKQAAGTLQDRPDIAAHDFEIGLAFDRFASALNGRRRAQALGTVQTIARARLDDGDNSESSSNFTHGSNDQKLGGFQPFCWPRYADAARRRNSRCTGTSEQHTVAGCHD